ncbi:MAG: nucleotidyltransferase domain-containing protein [Desulfobacterales bacterium]|nr:nucleotidyltransferase domain-containing protein [Desulfobacterales bacterium]
MKEKILQKLSDTEKEKNIRIIFAAESGSRAWGFPSKDSDYDVRFIFVHPVDWYLSVFDKQDIIELPVDELLDISGWDIRKSLKLLRKSNSAILEWLSSPIVYRSYAKEFKILQSLSETAFLPGSSFYHYFSLAKNSMAKSEGNDGIRIKTYLYSLRALLCCQWIISERSQPPMLFGDLLSEYLRSGEVREATDRLLGKRKISGEVDTVEKSPVLEKYINSQFEKLESKAPKNPEKTGTELYDSVFRKIIRGAENTFQHRNNNLTEYT